MRIGLISDTHSYLDPSILEHFSTCDEIWHAGDIGDIAVLDKLKGSGKLVRAIFGNIDGPELRSELSETLVFNTGGAKVFMTHIAGYPGRYNRKMLKTLEAAQPDIVVTGHSHILKVMYDKALDHLHINPGASGNHGFHKIRTAIRFTIKDGICTDMQVIELGQRGTLTS